MILVDYVVGWKFIGMFIDMELVVGILCVWFYCRIVNVSVVIVRLFIVVFLG